MAAGGSLGVSLGGVDGVGLGVAGDNSAVPEVEVDDGAPGAALSGAHAASTVSPAPAARIRANVRLLGIDVGGVLAEEQS